MLKQNESEFIKSNIIQWQKDNLGENTHIVVLDTGKDLFKYYNNVTIKTFDAPFKEATEKKNHGNSILATGYTIAPKAKVTYIPFANLKGNGKDDALDWIVANEKDIDVITMSMNYSYNYNRIYFDKLKNILIPFFVAVGNDGDDNINSPSDAEYTIAVSAYSDYFNSISSYSNWGEGIDILGFTDIAYLNDKDDTVMQPGTSIATPFVAFSTLLYISWRKRNGLPKLTRSDWKEWQKIYAKDIEDKGYDLRSGLGIFRLPSEIPIFKKEEEKVKEDISDKEIINIKEGEKIKPILTFGSKGDDVKLLQTKLNSLELNVGLADGIFGGNTSNAVKELQSIFNLTSDGVVGSQTYSLLDKLDTIRNFSLKEFRCRHCGKLKLNINLLLKLEELRIALDNKSMIINSGYRCPTHNTNVGGIKNSEHLKGNAADIRVVGIVPDDVHKVADTMFNGVGKYNTFTHVDVGVNRYRWDNSTKKNEDKPTSKTKLIKKFNSNIFYIETTSNQFVDVDLGIRFKKETVREIVKSKKAIAGINGGFFGVSKASEHIGLYIDEGLYYNPPNSDFIEFIYYKSGLTEIINMAGYDKNTLSKLQTNTHWAIGTSYSLVQRGKINLLNADKFSHSTSKQPRTMLGQKFDGTFILAVADGRSAISKGLTAKEQAEVMLELGCYNAINLDGGGSSTMVVADEVVNKPSDGIERKVGSVVLVKNN